MFLVKFAVAVLFVASLPGLAYACSCMRPGSPAEEMKRAAAVFSGRVREIRMNESPGDPFAQVVVTLSVDRLWKGEKKPELTVHTASHSAACGYSFSRGESYIVYAHSSDGRLMTGLCTRTAKLKDAAADVNELDRATAPPAAQTEVMPKWLSDHFAFMTQGSGRWITDNAKYKSAEETFEAYGTEWRYGPGKQSISGRLFGLRDGKEVGDFWEYRVFWHPAQRTAKFEQFGAGGVYGEGEMRIQEGRSSANRVELTFYAPNGTTWRDLHVLTESGSEHTTDSFILERGAWKPQRTYVWRLAKN